MKDITSYLLNLSNSLNISNEKKERIDASIAFMIRNLWGYFQSRLSEVTVIGSFDRSTNISNDPDSDVDIIVVFKQKEVQPETFLRQLKDFCEKNYSRSEIYQDHPTIVIDMEHIKFELVPSYFYSEITKRIPAPRSKDFRWISTSPAEFKKNVEEKDKNNKGLIKPIIKILKYWNYLNGKEFSSYEIERVVINKSYSCTTLRDYYFYATSALIDSATTDKQQKICNELKERNRRLRILEQYKIPEYIEMELSAFLPLP